MTLVSSGGTERVGKHAGGSRWTPRWLQRQREDREVSRWVAELGRQWSVAAEGAQLTRNTTTPAKISLTLTPQLHSVEMGPPVTLLVEMLPGQVADDFQTQAHRIAESMGVPTVHIEPYDTGWVTVALVEQ